MKTCLPQSRQLAAAAFAIITIVAGGAAQGQNPRLRYPVPERGPLSPYLDLLRSDAGVLPPYHAFVQPRRAVQQQLSQQRQAITGLQTELSQAARFSSDSMSHRPTGGGGHFQTYLHYYDFRPQRP